MQAPVIDTRRSVLKATGLALGGWGTGAWSTLGLLAVPGAALAQTPAHAPSRSPAFQSQTLPDALRQIRGAGDIRPVGDAQIQLQVPELSENGAMVPVSVNSLVADTRRILLLIEKNPYPLVASFDIPEGTEAGFQTRVKMAQSSRMLVLVQAGQGPDTRYYMTAKDIRVTLGGCGA